MRIIEQVWFQNPWFKWPLIILLLPLVLLFALVTSVRRVAFRIGLFKSIDISVPVVVVGNITVGGNGKTPLVIFLVELCQKLGLKPGVISRGYGGQAEYYPYELNDSSTPEQAGDEPVLIFQRCQVPVVVGSDRVAGCQKLVSLGCNIIISDDGLQHYRLGRAMELIVVDGKRKFGNQLLMPAGPLREGLWRLKSAQHVIVNGGSYGVDNIGMELEANCVVNIKANEKLTINEFINRFDKVNAIAGIGDPNRFFQTLADLKVNVNQSIAFVDHHKFTPDDFSHLKDDIPLIMTEKDKVKCTQFAKQHWWYLPVDGKISPKDAEKIAADIQVLLNLKDKESTNGV